MSFLTFKFSLWVREVKSGGSETSPCRCWWLPRLSRSARAARIVPHTPLLCLGLQQGKGSSRIQWCLGCCGEPRQGRAAPGAAGTIGDALERAERFSLDAQRVLECLGAARWFRTANCSRAVLLVFQAHISAPTKPVHGLVKMCCGHITDPAGDGISAWHRDRSGSGSCPAGTARPRKARQALCIPLCAPQTPPPARPNPLLKAAQPAGNGERQCWPCLLSPVRAAEPSPGTALAQPRTAPAACPADIPGTSGHLAGLAERVWREPECVSCALV